MSEAASLPEPAEAGPPSRNDERMAELLAGDRRALAQARESLGAEAGEDAADLRARLHAIDFLDEIVNDQQELPERIADYRITGLLGRGGMGTVYEAWHEALERDVALKVLSPTLSADAGMRRRFRSEARANAALHHPNIVPIYDYGEAGGLLFFAMERVDGISLDKQIANARRRGQPLYEPREAARRFAGVADALAHAHARKILHRDVKPGNLLVDAGGNLALADFGLSKSLGEPRASLALTSAGGFLGTLAYAAPEQALGRALSPASDLYALGVTLFEALTGELPLPAMAGESSLQVLLEGRPRRLRELLPKAPRDLELVLERLLEKEPQDRYPDGESLARDLQRIADGEPVRIRRQSIVVRLARTARKNPATAALIAASVLLLLASLVMWNRNRLNREALNAAEHGRLLRDAVLAAQSDPGPACGPRGLLEALLGTPLDVPPANARALEYLDAAARLDVDRNAVELLRRDLADDPLPGVTNLLRAGHGHRARIQYLDRVIADTAPQLATRDEGTLLRMYVLYVMRAVASLTASVGRPADALEDLIRANVLRGGAWLPNLLVTLLKWDPELGVGELQQALAGVLANAPPSGARVAALLVGAWAGGRRADGSHLMTFDFDFAVRRDLVRLAAQLDGAELPLAPGYTGLERELAAIARSAFEARADVPRLRAIVDPALRLLDEQVAPAAELQCWRFVFALLQEPNASARLADGSEMPGAMQVQAWVRLFELHPADRYLDALRGRVDQLLQSAPEGPESSRLRALLAEHGGSPEDLLAAAQRWLHDAPDDPRPLLARFRAYARLDRDVEAASAAAQAIQISGEREWVVPKIAGILDDLGLGKDAADPKWRRLRAALCGAGS